MANLKIDLLKSSFQNVLALINEANPAAALTEADITLGLPTGKAADGAGRNTTVTVSATPEALFYGSVDVNYRRLALATETHAAPVYAFNIGKGQDVAATIAEIEAAWGLLAGEIEVTLPSLEGADQGDAFKVNVTAKAGSLLYTADPVEVTLNYQEPTLASLILVTDLNGFDPVEAAPAP